MTKLFKTKGKIITILVLVLSLFFVFAVLGSPVSADHICGTCPAGWNCGFDGRQCCEDHGCTCDCSGQPPGVCPGNPCPGSCCGPGGGNGDDDCEAPTLNSVSAVCQQNGSADVSWNWSSIPGVDRYRLQYAESSNFSLNPTEVDKSATSYSTNISDPITQRWHRVRVQSSLICNAPSGWSNVIGPTSWNCNVPPPTPTLVYTERCDNLPEQVSVTLGWEPPTGNIHIERCIGLTCDNWGEIAAHIPSPYTDHNVDPGITYRYRVYAHDHITNLKSYSNVITATPTCPRCSIIFIGSQTLQLGETKEYTVSVTNLVNFDLNDFQSLNYTSSPDNIVLPSSLTPWDTIGPHSFDLTTAPAAAPNDPVDLTMKAYSVNHPGEPVCEETKTVTIGGPGPWWQVIGGDVITKGNISSSIADSSAYLIRDGLGGFPGVPIFGNSSNITPPPGGSPGISSTDWNASSGISAKFASYTYEHFLSLIPPNIHPDPIDRANLSTCGSDASFNGYCWFKGSGNETITIDGQNIGNARSVVFHRGKLEIAGDITIDTNGFLLVLTDDHIDILPSVEYLDGIYFAQKQFKIQETSSDNALNVRGMVATQDFVHFGRDLEGGNVHSAAEIFEFAPEFLFKFPIQLIERSLIWKEVAP